MASKSMQMILACLSDTGFEVGRWKWYFSPGLPSVTGGIISSESVGPWDINASKCFSAII